MKRIGIIGSTGIDIRLLSEQYTFESVQVGEETFKFYRGICGDAEIILTARNQYRGSVAPHNVNYKLIMEGMKALGTDVVIGTSVSGSLSPDIPPHTYLVLDQFLDFTKRSPFTAFDKKHFAFVDFSEPYCPVCRRYLIAACKESGVRFLPKGCYVGVDGPRYETNAEVRLFGKLGGDVVGMTNVPEAIMARETGQCYASLSLVSNYGAGIGEKAEVLRKDCYEKTIETVDHTIDILLAFIRNYDGQKDCNCAEKISDMLYTEEKT